MFNGYGYYLLGAYLPVIALLMIQWWLPWRRWKNYLRQRNAT